MTTGTEKQRGNMSAKKNTQKIWCAICQDYIDRNELKLWTGDDSYHHLCPGCDSDLLPQQTEAEVRANIKKEFDHDHGN